MCIRDSVQGYVSLCLCLWYPSLSLVSVSMYVSVPPLSVQQWCVLYTCALFILIGKESSATVEYLAGETYTSSVCVPRSYHVGVRTWCRSCILCFNLTSLRPQRRTPEVKQSNPKQGEALKVS